MLFAPKLLVAVTLALGVAACAQPPAEERPAWLQARIAQAESLARSSPPRAILRTTYQGRTVYYVSATCCDIPSELYDDKGVLLCYPDGGFAGGDGRCPAFTLQPGSVTVWRDQRPASTRGPAAALPQPP